MNLPFGLDLKSLIVGILLSMFVIPYLTGMIKSRTADSRATTA